MKIKKEKAINNIIDSLLLRRSNAVKSLVKSLKHLPREKQYVVITSWIPLNELEKLAVEQKRG